MKNVTYAMGCVMCQMCYDVECGCNAEWCGLWLCDAEYVVLWDVMV